MIYKIGYFLAGFLLIPLVVSSWVRFPVLFTNFNGRDESVVYLFFGMVLYLLFETIFDRPLKTYVFGHELTHALASITMGGKVHSFEVGKSGGSVSISKTNFFVALAPYCIPLYTFLILIFYYLIKLLWPVQQYHLFFLLAVGFSFAFHISLTVFAIRQGQPDLKNTGIFFSLIFILLVNSWVLVILSKVLFWNSVSVRVFCAEVIRTQNVLWVWIFNHLVILWKWGSAQFFEWRGN